MKRFRFTTWITALLLLAALCYIGYQVAANLTQSIQTMDAMEVTVEELVSARGWFIRQQTVVEGGSGSAAEYLVEDGEKVAQGQPLAVFFSGDEARLSYRETDLLRQRLSALEYAYSMVTSGVDSLKMDELIFDNVESISRKLSQGDAQVDGEYSAMQQLVASRGATENDRESFESQIALLRQEIAESQRVHEAGSTQLKAPLSGYFAGGLDGYEAALTPQMLDSLTPNQLKNLQPQTQEGVGSISTGFCWYYAVALTEEQAAPLRGRERLEVSFHELSSEPLEMEVYRLDTGADGQAILILKSTRMEKAYLTARESDIDIVVQRHTGLRIPSRALRQQDGQWGVFVLSGSLVTFKPVEWSYSTESYFLIPSAASAKEGLYRYDRVILQGKDIVDGMIISQGNR